MNPIPTAIIEQRIAVLAAGQHGVVARSQLLGLGMTPSRIQRFLASGRLRRKHHGVYLLGHLTGSLEPALAREMAAVLAGGPGTVVSHGHAAALWEIAPRPPAPIPVHVLVPGRAPLKRPGITAHRAPDLAPADVTSVRGIPVTTPLRTIRDLAAIATHRELERVVARAERGGLVNAKELEGLVARRRGRPGGPTLRAVIHRAGGPAFTRSEAETRFLDLIRGSGIPAPQVNAVVHGHEVDFYWPGHRIAVEIDGFAYHRSRRSFARDRQRDADLLTAAGVSVLRFTWAQVTRRQKATLVTLARALARPAPS